MKKYYATEVDTEHFDYDMYLDEINLAEQGIAIYGSRNYSDINGDLIIDTIRALENCEYDLTVAREDHKDGQTTDEEYEAEVLTTIGYYFNKELSKEDKFKLADLCRKYEHCSSREEEDIIVEVLSIDKQKEYKTVGIRGCCQGDYNTMYCPKETSQEYIELIEAIYFATGTEFAITENAVEEDEADDADTYYDYTYLDRADDIKEWLAKNIGCTKEEVVIRTIKKRYTHYTYDYEVN